jgi:hypothetical protein
MMVTLRVTRVVPQADADDSPEPGLL